MAFPRTLTGGIAALLAIVALLASTYSPPAGAETLLRGSGASFPYPIYIRWMRDVSADREDLRIVYRATGSGAGIRVFTAGSVDFAGSDSPMTDKELAQVKRGTVALPVTAGSIVLAYNLKGVNNLKLPRDVYTSIFLGQISRWSHPKIAVANPGVRLPDIPITIAVRSDSSGTTHILTSHLSAISQEFARRAGTSRQLKWPSPKNTVKAPGSEGVAAWVKRSPGAIGYIEQSFAELVELPVAQLQNRAGNFVAPGSRSGTAALAEIEFPGEQLTGSSAPNLFAQVRDPQAEDAYPIIGLTWLLFYSNSGDSKKAAILRQMVRYMLTDEAQIEAGRYHYIPLPPEMRQKVRAAAEFIR